MLDCSGKKNQIENNKHYYCAGWNEVSKDKDSYRNGRNTTSYILGPKKREEINFENDKDNISSEETEKRINNCCLMTGAFMNMAMLSIVLSLQILSMNKDTMIILPKLGKDKYCKLEGSSLYIA